MDREFEKEIFETLKIKKSVARKFRVFSRSMGLSQSMTLLVMIDFFDENGISPNETFGPKIQTLENLIKKRVNAIIAIVRDIEKNQTKPTLAMIQSLFEGFEPEKKPLLLEKETANQEKKVKYVERNSTGV